MLTPWRSSALFVIGGLSGVFLASTPVDIPLHDTYFVVAHIHYVLFGGSLFGIFGAITFWFPKMFGRMMNEALGRIHFVLTFILFNLVFFPMHMLGSGGMMRRLYDTTEYPHLQPMQDTNVILSIAALLLFGVQLHLRVNFFWSLFRGEEGGGEPVACELARVEPRPRRRRTATGAAPRQWSTGDPYEYSVPDREDPISGCPGGTRATPATPAAH
jgi:heme/copper-type cytochrome/quinol oxidase subunit 1